MQIGFSKKISESLLEDTLNYIISNIINSKKLKYINLPKRFGESKYPRTHVVDMLKDQNESGKFGLILSGLLLDKIEDRLKKNEQILILQNRRG